MLYVGFLAVGVGILLTVSGLICLAIGTFSQETNIAKTAKNFAKRLLFGAFFVLMMGIGVLGLKFDSA
ncbi:hypothetical protein MOMA_01095 [Moraxella macacae 0408225]|uniref:Uncharacterized protein n=1 Tax=Moraxella macacae 0408225 TaxID=1230338 RepID=L2F7F4_9GAMM|nr:hypothetical protein [Moraxella macacae]ELA08962.1 hypothetical protein MOMA_01095 [Moraxella macacae 0408225]